MLVVKKPLWGVLATAILLLAWLLCCIYTPSAQADSISQTYQSTSFIPTSSAVVLVSGSESNIELANSDNADRLLGIAINQSQALVNLDSTGGNVSVVSNGNVTAYVSDINGEVKSGDYLTASPVAGVLMKATAAGPAIGQAQADFSSATSTETKQIRDKDGNSQAVKIGLLSIYANRSTYDAGGTLSGNGLVRGLQAFALSTTGKTISPIRAVVALLVLLIAVAVSIIILYTSVASSIRSIGRNPLSKHAILQSLIQVIIAVVAIMMSGFSIVYLIIGR